MAKLWLTDRAYPLWSYLLRIGYWFVAIYVISLYLEYYSEQSWFKVGLMLLSVAFVGFFLILARCLDHFFKPQES